MITNSELFVVGLHQVIEQFAIVVRPSRISYTISGLKECGEYHITLFIMKERMSLNCNINLKKPVYRCNVKPGQIDLKYYVISFTYMETSDASKITSYALEITRKYAERVLSHGSS